MRSGPNNPILAVGSTRLISLEISELHPRIPPATLAQADLDRLDGGGRGDHDGEFRLKHVRELIRNHGEGLYMSYQLALALAAGGAFGLANATLLRVGATSVHRVYIDA